MGPDVYSQCPRSPVSRRICSDETLKEAHIVSGKSRRHVYGRKHINFYNRHIRNSGVSDREVASTLACRLSGYVF